MTDALKEQWEKTQERFEDLCANRTYYADCGYKKMFSCNVKLHSRKNTEPKLDENIKKLNVTAEEEKRLREMYTDEYINDLWWLMVEDNQHYAHEMITGLCWSPEDKNPVDLACRVIGLEYIKQHAGFYGRQGGHFCIAKVDLVEDILNEYDERDTDDEEEIKERDRDNLDCLNRANELMDAIETVLDWAKEYAEKLDFGEFVFDSIGNELDFSIRPEIEKEKEHKEKVSHALAICENKIQDSDEREIVTSFIK